jgi:hypothetical protein
MKKIYFLMLIAMAILCFMLPVQAQPIVPLPIVTMTPSYYTQMAIFCPGGSLRMWEYETGKGLIYCEAPTPIPTRPTSTPISTRPAPTSTPTPYIIYAPFVAKGN